MRFLITVGSLYSGNRTLRKEWEYSSFLKSENAYLPSREIQVSKVSSFF